MPRRRQAFCRLFFGICFLLILSPVQSWSLTISTSARTNGYRNQIYLDENTASGGNITSYVENLPGSMGFASSSASGSDTGDGFLSVSAQASDMVTGWGSCYIARASWSDVICNRGATALNYLLNLDISPIILATNGYSNASYGISVLLNSELIWSTSAYISNYDLMETTSDIIAPQTALISLGKLGINQSFDLEYFITARCYSMETGTSDVNPFSVSGTITTAHAAPEPSTLILLGMGLAGVAFTIKRRSGK